MHSAITLRASGPDDAPFLFDVYASMRDAEMASLPWSPEQKQTFLRMQFGAQQAHYTHVFASARFQIIQEQGQPVGRILIDRRPEEIRLIDIGLLPASRGRGLGTFLLKSLIEEAKESARPLRLHVERFNSASRLYRRLGFREVQDTGVYLLMEWSLPG